MMFLWWKLHYEILPEQELWNQFQPVVVSEKAQQIESCKKSGKNEKMG